MKPRTDWKAQAKVMEESMVRWRDDAQSHRDEKFRLQDELIKANKTIRELIQALKDVEATIPEDDAPVHWRIVRDALNKYANN